MPHNLLWRIISVVDIQNPSSYTTIVTSGIVETVRFMVFYELW